jgi:hypothetical protein
MAENVYATYRCGSCINDAWCDKCKQDTLNANGGKLPSNWSGQREALEAYLRRVDSRSAGK